MDTDRYLDGAEAIKRLVHHLDQFRSLQELETFLIYCQYEIPIRFSTTLYIWRKNKQENNVEQ